MAEYKSKNRPDAYYVEKEIRSLIGAFRRKAEHSNENTYQKRSAFFCAEHIFLPVGVRLGYRAKIKPQER